MKLLINLILLITLTTQAQRKISIAVNQDAKFLFVGDKERGYDAGTLNLVTRIKLQGHQLEHGYMVVAPEFEYADIEGIYKRYSANVGYTFNRWIPNIETSAYIGYGWIDRYGKTTFSGSASGEVAYKINDWLKVNVFGQLTHRTDLKWLWNDDVVRFSGFIGFEVNLN